MGKRGPRPEPRTLQIAKNTWRAKKRPAEPDEVDGEMERPEWLGPIAAEKWDQMIPILVGRKTVSPAYVDFLAFYCQAHQDYHDACRVIEDQGEFVHSEKGGVYQHPAVGMRNKAIERIAKFGREFGLSPTSIRDIQVNSSGKKETGKKRFFGA